MNAPTGKIEAAPAGLELLRAPFPEHQISKLPKETRAQIDARKADKNLMVWKCTECGGAHHAKAVHLDYVGHAALTDRLLDADPEWSWEPLAVTDLGLPAFDQTGGLWIKLTVCGVSRLGYGHAAAKPNADPGSREKEIIGDALRNAAMRFGAALDLWHKGDLHLEEQSEGGPGGDNSEARQVSPTGTADQPQARQPRQKLDGPHTSWTALDRAVKEFDRELRACGDVDMLAAYLATEDAKALRIQLLRDAPHYLEGGPGLPEEFEPLDGLVNRLRHDFEQLATANQMTEFARN